MKYLYLVFCSSIVLLLFNCVNKKTVIEPKNLEADFAFEIGEKGKVSFINKSLNADQFYWDFGDSLGTSIEKNPEYTFPFRTSFQVTLKAKNSLEQKDISKIVDLKSTDIPTYGCDDNMIGLNFENRDFCASKNYVEYQIVDIAKKEIESMIWLDKDTTNLFLFFQTHYILGEAVNIVLNRFESIDYTRKKLTDSTSTSTSTFSSYKPVNGWLKVTKVEGQKLSGEVAFIVYVDYKRVTTNTYSNNLFTKEEIVNIVPKSREKILVKGTFKNLQNRNR